MPGFTGSVGRLLVESALPQHLRGRYGALDKATLRTLQQDLAKEGGDVYRDVVQKLLHIGSRISDETGGGSFQVDDLRKPAEIETAQQELQRKLNAVLSNPSFDDKSRNEEIIRLTRDFQKGQPDRVFDLLTSKGNPVALPVKAGSRGGKSDLVSIMAGDGLYEDHLGNVVPFPVLRSYSQGLDPDEYWAGVFGARKGIYDTKISVANSGYWNKRASQSAHRLVVVDVDGDGVPDTTRGLPVDTSDPDNEGALLAHDAGPFKRNTVLTPRKLKQLQAAGHDRILVRSPLVGSAPGGGVYAYDVGVRERGVIPGVGENIGVPASQAIGEKVTQATLKSKHVGGVASGHSRMSGYGYLNSLIEFPKEYAGRAAHSQKDGVVQRIVEAPAGGYDVYINGDAHYVPINQKLSVKVGDTLEAGDILSDGVPDPSEIVRHKGVGEGGRYFVDTMRQAIKASGLSVDRRNIEVLSRGLIDHVELDEEMEDNVPGDVVSYRDLERDWRPREDAADLAVTSAKGKYLEKPYLHYSIGTLVRPSAVKELQRFKIDRVVANDRPPPFRPAVVRASANLQHDPDWMVQMFGSGLKSSFLDSAQRARTSDADSTSYVPAVAKGVDFGRVGAHQPPRPGIAPPPEPEETLQPVKLPSLSKAAKHPALARLLQAKAESDARRYPHKHEILRSLYAEAPDDFIVDSERQGVMGLTHRPTNFRLHVPANILPIKAAGDEGPTSFVPLTRGTIPVVASGTKFPSERVGVPSTSGADRSSGSRLASGSSLSEAFVKPAVASHMTTSTENDDVIGGIVERVAVDVMAIDPRFATIGARSQLKLALGSLTAGVTNGDVSFPVGVLFSSLVVGVGHEKSSKPHDTEKCPDCGVSLEWGGLKCNHCGSKNAPPGVKKASPADVYIIKGNPSVDAENAAKYDDFYGQVKSHVEGLGHTAAFDDGKPHTTPPGGKFWIGHSRGGDRLQYAPKFGARGLRLDDYEPAEARTRQEAEYQRLFKELGVSQIADVPVDRRPQPGPEHHTYSPEMRAAVEAMLGQKMAASEIIPGGKSSGKPDSAFPAKVVAEGAKVESEHTDNKALAREIARDHLTESLQYYDELQKMEKNLGKGASDVLYHGSPVSGLKRLEPKPSKVLGGASAVFGTPDRDLATTYLAPWTDDDFEQGYVNGVPYLKEKQPGAFRRVFGGRKGTLYQMPADGAKADKRLMPEERLHDAPIDVDGAEDVDDALEAVKRTRFRLIRHPETPDFEDEYQKVRRFETDLMDALGQKHAAFMTRQELIEEGNRAIAKRKAQGKPDDLSDLRKLALSPSPPLKPVTPQSPATPGAAPAPVPAPVPKPAVNTSWSGWGTATPPPVAPQPPRPLDVKSMPMQRPPQAPRLTTKEQNAFNASQPAGVRNPSYNVGTTTLRDEVGSFYEKIPGGVDAVIAKAREAQQSRNPLGPLAIGDMQYDTPQRVIVSNSDLQPASNAALLRKNPNAKLQAVEGMTYPAMPKSPVEGADKPTVMISRGAKDPTLALRHEITHAAVPTVPAKAMDSVVPDTVNHIGRAANSFFSPRELDPRLSDLKRRYAQETGEVVDSPAAANRALEWGAANPTKLPSLMGGKDDPARVNPYFFQQLDRTFQLNEGSRDPNDLQKEHLLNRMMELVQNGRAQGPEKIASLVPGVSLQPHQQEVVDLAKKQRAEDGKVRMMLYHGLGSGKSLSSLAAMDALGAPYSAIVPASLRPNYVKEQKKFLDPAKSPPGEVVSHTAVGGGRMPKSRNIVVDEWHRLRNPESLQSQNAVRALKDSDAAVLLTGTPVVNDPGDFAPAYEVLTGKRMTPDQFRSRYVGDPAEKPGWLARLLFRSRDPGVAHADELRRNLEGKVHYYKPKDSGIDVQHEDVKTEMSDDQASLYRSMYGKLPFLLRWKLERKYPMTQPELRRLTSFMTGLRQVGLSTLPFMKGNPDPIRAFNESPKLQEASRRLNATLSANPKAKALVFSNYIDSGLGAYAAGLKAKGLPVGVFSGELSDAQRKQLVDDYNANKLRVALLGPSGTEGLSFKGTRLMQILDPYWNAVRGDQSEGRGIRFDSHTELPPEDRNVKVERYLAQLPPSGWRKWKRRLGFDVPSEPAADEHLRGISDRKQQLNQAFLKVLQDVGSRN